MNRSAIQISEELFRFCPLPSDVIDRMFILTDTEEAAQCTL